MTQEQIKNILDAAREYLEQAKEDISGSTQDKSIKERLYEYTDEAQTFLNRLLSKTGVITDEEINKLDEQMRRAKRELEIAKAEKTKRNFMIVAGLLVLGFGALWIITKKKKVQ